MHRGSGFSWFCKTNLVVLQATRVSKESLLSHTEHDLVLQGPEPARAFPELTAEQNANSRG